MKISPQWVREFVELAVDDLRLAEDLTAVGIAVEGINGSGPDTVFEMEIGTNRPDAMNHYGVAREAAAIYDLPLKPIEPKLSSRAKAPSSAAVHGAAGRRALSKETSASSGGAVKAAPSSGSHGATEVVSLLGVRSSTLPLNDAIFPITVEEPQLCPRFSA